MSPIAARTELPICARAPRTEQRTERRPKGSTGRAISARMASPQARGPSAGARQHPLRSGSAAAIRSATPMEQIRAVPAVFSGTRGAYVSTPAVGGVSSGSRHHFAKARVAGSSPVVRFNVLHTRRRRGSAPGPQRATHPARRTPAGRAEPGVGDDRPVPLPLMSSAVLRAIRPDGGRRS